MIDVYRDVPAPTKAPNLECEIFSRRWNRACVFQYSMCSSVLYVLVFYMFQCSICSSVLYVLVFYQSLPSPCLANIARLCETRSEITNFLLLWDRVDRRSTEHNITKGAKIRNSYSPPATDLKHRSCHVFWSGKIVLTPALFL